MAARFSTAALPVVSLAIAYSFAAPRSDTFDKTVQPFVTRNCYGCHNEKLTSGGLNLRAYHSTDDVLKGREQWEHVVEKLKAGEMPPKGMPRPDPAQVTAVTNWLQAEFTYADKHMKPDPGRVTAHRLNRYEYNNTVRDLLAVDFKPAEDFPADDYGYGFDNIGDVLSLSPVLMEKYLAAAEKIAKTAIYAGPLPKPTVLRHKNSLRNRTDYELKLPFAFEADYRFNIGVTGRRDPLAVVFSIDGKDEQRFPLERDPNKSRNIELTLHVPYGEHALEAKLVEDHSMSEPPVRRPPQLPPGVKPKPQPPAPPTAVDYIEIRGPYKPLPPPLSESEKRIFICGHARGQHSEQCARTDLANLARLAYRRPVSAEEVNRLAGFVEMAQKDGDSFEQGMRVALEAVLVSPHFLFRIERDPNPADPKAQHRLNDYELASRLSYFLWSSMPDAELFRSAAEGKLHKPQVLAAQVRRMLQDAKSSALVDNFGGQWLELRNLDSVKPDPDKFPEFDNDLRHAMRRETELFFNEIIHQDRSILDFLNGKFTYVNEHLAKFYGIPGVTGKEFRRVDLTGNEQRSGILTQASVLTVSSYPNRTSPVIRGKWILENLLNAPPPPPPPNVPNLDEAAVGVKGTVRQQFEAHRANPVCASCHVRMDPLGFGLENYDAIGRWRTHEGKFPIDATGTLPGGQNFDGAADLKEILRSNPEEFTRALAEKLMIYALGRGLERYDRPAVNLVCRHVAENKYRFSSLVLEIVKSMPFEMRRGEANQRTAVEFAHGGSE